MAAKPASEVWRLYATDGVPASGPNSPNRRDVLDWASDVDDQLEELVSADAVTKGTWSDLLAVTGTRNGQRGEVLGPDAGTHTDPVVGGTVANEGVYAWETGSPGGWERLGDVPELEEQAAEVLDRLDPLLRQYILCPVVEIEGREVQPTELTFDLYVIRGTYVDDGTLYPDSGGSSSLARVEREFPTIATPTFTDWVGVIVYGQSLSLGYGVGALTTAAIHPDRVLMFNAGPRADPDDAATDMASAVDLVENTYNPGGGTYGETPLSALCNGFLEYAALSSGEALDDLPILFGHCPGVTGVAIEPLRTTYYPRVETSMEEANTLSGSETYMVGIVVFDQGESDQGRTAQATYQSRLRTLYNQVVASANSETGQTDDPIMLIKQIAWSAQPLALTGDGLSNDFPASVTLGVAAEEGDGIVIAFPDYWLPFLLSDGQHRAQHGYVLAGRMYARAASRILIEGKDWRGLQVKSAVIKGDECRVTFRVPVQPLRLDTVNVGATTQSGFKITDDSGNLPIVSVAVETGDTVVLTLGRARDGEATLRYALDYLPAGSTMYSGSAGGNLRDSDTETFTVSSTDYLLANWCQAFEITPFIAEAV